MRHSETVCATLGVTLAPFDAAGGVTCRSAGWFKSYSSLHQGVTVRPNVAAGRAVRDLRPWTVKTKYQGREPGDDGRVVDANTGEFRFRIRDDGRVVDANTGQLVYRVSG